MRTCHDSSQSRPSGMAPSRQPRIVPYAGRRRATSTSVFGLACSRLPAQHVILESCSLHECGPAYSNDEKRRIHV